MNKNANLCTDHYDWRMEYSSQNKWHVLPRVIKMDSTTSTTWNWQWASNRKAGHNLSKRRNVGQAETIAIHQITFIPVPHKTLQINVKREVRDR